MMSFYIHCERKRFGVGTTKKEAAANIKQIRQQAEDEIKKIRKKIVVDVDAPAVPVVFQHCYLCRDNFDSY